MQGNIAGVTSSLGVAFNSTFIALLISMVVMFFYAPVATYSGALGARLSRLL